MEANTQPGVHFVAEPRWPITGGLLDLVLDELAYGVAVTTREGDLLHANNAARHELSRRQGLVLHNGRLLAQPQDKQLLEDALAKAAGGRRSLIVLGETEADRISVAVVPVQRRDGQSHAAILFSRASVCDSLMLCFFARNHALTPAEENVLAHLCRGHSAPEVARNLRVAVSTIRSHVRALCAKTRTNGVRELVSRVAMLPSVATALLYEPAH